MKVFFVFNDLIIDEMKKSDLSIESNYDIVVKIVKDIDFKMKIVLVKIF